MVFDNHKFLLTSIVFLFVRKKIWCVGFFLHQITAVFFVTDNTENNGILPFLNTTRQNAFFPKFTGDNMSSFSFVHKLMKDKAYNLCAFLIDGHFSTFYIIAEHTASKHNALLHLALLSPFDTLGSLSAFLLCNRRHYGKTKLRIAVYCDKSWPSK